MISPNDTVPIFLSMFDFPSIAIKKQPVIVKEKTKLTCFPAIQFNQMVGKNKNKQDQN